MISHSVEETEKVANDLAEKLESGEVICLYGELGAGKTAFVKGLAKKIGVKDRVISPTFNIIREHDVNFKSIKKMYHIDIYRLEDLSEIKNIGIEEIFSESNMVVLIEWADKMKDLLPNKRIDVNLEVLGLNERRITIERHGYQP